MQKKKSATHDKIKICEWKSGGSDIVPSIDNLGNG